LFGSKESCVIHAALYHKSKAGKEKWQEGFVCDQRFLKKQEVVFRRQMPAPVLERRGQIFNAELFAENSFFVSVKVSTDL